MVRRLPGLALLAMVSLAPAEAQDSKPRIEDDINYRHFIGATDTKFYPVTPFGGYPGLCTSLAKRVTNYPGVSFDLPTFRGTPMKPVPTDWTGPETGTPFEQLMIHAVDPKSQDLNPYVQLTRDAPGGGVEESYEEQLQAKILGSPDQVSPANVMDMALQVTGGNYPLATLTAHNLLKGIAYSGREVSARIAEVIKRQGRKPMEFPPAYGQVASKLINMRDAPGDKMGPWYHLFVVLSISAWTNDPEAQEKALMSEYGVRMLGSLTNMGSPMDREKQQIDLCFNKAAKAIYAHAHGEASPHEVPAAADSSTTGVAPIPPVAPVPVPVAPAPAAAGSLSQTKATVITKDVKGPMGYRTFTLTSCTVHDEDGPNNVQDFVWNFKDVPAALEPGKPYTITATGSVKSIPASWKPWFQSVVHLSGLEPMEMVNGHKTPDGGNDGTFKFRLLPGAKAAEIGLACYPGGTFATYAYGTK